MLSIGNNTVTSLLASVHKKKEEVRLLNPAEVEGRKNTFSSFKKCNNSLLTIAFKDALSWLIMIS